MLAPRSSHGYYSLDRVSQQCKWLSYLSLGPKSVWWLQTIQRFCLYKTVKTKSKWLTLAEHMPAILMSWRDLSGFWSARLMRCSQCIENHCLKELTKREAGTFPSLYPSSFGSPIPHPPLLCSTGRGCPFWSSSQRILCICTVW